MPKFTADEKPRTENRLSGAPHPASLGLLWEGHLLTNGDDKAGTGDPFAGFTDWQWYSQVSRQSVYYAAFSASDWPSAALRDLARNLIRHAPQLIAHLPDLRDADAIPDTLIDRIVSRTETDTLDPYPDCQNVEGNELFDATDLPMVRLRAVTRRGGPDSEGRAACLTVISSHALLEGADSALLSRSRTVARTQGAQDQTAPGWPYLLLASVLVPIQLLLARLMLPRVDDRAFRTLSIPRTRLKRLAKHLGVRQRSLMFALVTYALNTGKALGRRKISVIYTDLDATPEKGQFFRFRMVESAFRVHDDFRTFVTGIDARLTSDAASGATFSHAFIGAMMNRHRRLKQRLPFLYSHKTFRFTGFYAFDLSLVPPHRLEGALSTGLREPVFCGTSHPGLQSCVFSPGEQWITFNFNMRAPHLQNVSAIADLLDRLEQQIDDRGHAITATDMT